MIVKNFYISDLDLKYLVGINQIRIFDITLDFILNLMEKIQKNHRNSTLQFFSDKYILNQDHIFTACYYTQKAFSDKTNISKTKNIELFLYLTTKRQIKNAIEAFGINLKSDKKTSYVIISNENNLNRINEEVLDSLGANEVELTINDQSVKKFNQIKSYFEISDNQINSVLNSYGAKEFKNDPIANNLNNLFLAVYDLICEKMAFLSLEKIKAD